MKMDGHQRGVVSIRLVETTISYIWHFHAESLKTSRDEALLD